MPFDAFFSGCLVKVEVPVCYYRESLSGSEVFYRKNPYINTCDRDKIDLIRSEEGRVRVYLNGKFWKEFSGCVR